MHSDLDSMTNRDFCESMASPEVMIRGSDVQDIDTGTCQWLAESATFKTWLHSTSGLLWVTGKPGCGKSVLMKHILHNHLLNNDKNFTVSFFCNPWADENQRSRLGLLRSIIYQLSTPFLDAFSHLARRFHQMRTLLPAGQDVLWSENELLDAIKTALPLILKTHSLHFLVDSIDTCGDDVAKKLALDFQKLVDKHKASAESSTTGAKGQSHSFRICFSSRPYPAKDPFPKQFIQVDSLNHSDIEKFVRHRLHHLGRTIQNSMVSQTGGIFLSAHLLAGIATASWVGIGLQQTLSSFAPADLSSLLRSIFGTLAHTQREKALALMTWACLSTKPLTLAELRVALALEVKADDTQFWRCLWRTNDGLSLGDEELETNIPIWSAGLVEVVELHGERVVQPVHASVKESFVSEGLVMLSPIKCDGSKDSTLPNPVSQRHFWLASYCIRYLSLAAQETTSFHEPQEAQRHPELGLLRYAIRSWAKHAELAGTKGDHVSDLLKLLGCPAKALVNDLVRLESVFQADLAHHISQRLLNSSHGMTWLHLFAKKGLSNFLTTTMRKVSRESVNYQNENGHTPLHLAVAHSHKAAVVALLKKDANPNLKDANGQTVLHLAAGQGQTTILEILLENHADASACNAALQSPLHCAVATEHAASVRLLLKKDHTGVNAVDGIGFSALLHAVSVGNASIVRVLLEYGAIVDLRDGQGRCSLDIAAANSQKAVLRILLEEMFESGRSGGTSSSLLSCGKTALFAAIKSGNKTSIELIFKSSQVDINSRDQSSRTALIYAAQAGYPSIVRLLVSLGAHVNAKDAHGWTALMFLAQAGNTNLAKLLLDNGADMTLRNAEGHAAIFYAVHRQNDGDDSRGQKQSRDLAALLLKRYGKATAEWDAEWKACYQHFSEMELEFRALEAPAASAHGSSASRAASYLSAPSSSSERISRNKTSQLSLPGMVSPGENLPRLVPNDSSKRVSSGQISQPREAAIELTHGNPVSEGILAKSAPRGPSERMPESKGFHLDSQRRKPLLNNMSTTTIIAPVTQIVSNSGLPIAEYAAGYTQGSVPNVRPPAAIATGSIQRFTIDKALAYRGATRDETRIQPELAGQNAARYPKTWLPEHRMLPGRSSVCSIQATPPRTAGILHDAQIPTPPKPSDLFNRHKPAAPRPACMQHDNKLVPRQKSSGTLTHDDRQAQPPYTPACIQYGSRQLSSSKHNSSSDYYRLMPHRPDPARLQQETASKVTVVGRLFSGLGSRDSHRPDHPTSPGSLRSSRYSNNPHLGHLAGLGSPEFSLGPRLDNHTGSSAYSKANLFPNHNGSVSIGSSEPTGPSNLSVTSTLASASAVAIAISSQEQDSGLKHIGPNPSIYDNMPQRWSCGYNNRQSGLLLGQDSGNEDKPRLGGSTINQTIINQRTEENNFNSYKSKYESNCKSNQESNYKSSYRRTYGLSSIEPGEYETSSGDNTYDERLQSFVKEPHESSNASDENLYSSSSDSDSNSTGENGGDKGLEEDYQEGDDIGHNYSGAQDEDDLPDATSSWMSEAAEAYVSENYEHVDKSSKEEDYAKEDSDEDKDPEDEDLNRDDAEVEDDDVYDYEDVCINSNNTEEEDHELDIEDAELIDDNYEGETMLSDAKDQLWYGFGKEGEDESLYEEKTADEEGYGDGNSNKDWKEYIGQGEDEDEDEYVDENEYEYEEEYENEDVYD